LPAIAACIGDLTDRGYRYAAVTRLRTLNIYLLIAELRELVVSPVYIYGVALIRRE
jgi:hypothetical protein